MELLGTLRLLGTPTSIAVSCTLFATAFLFYRWLLPKPIPGIPYNAEATKSIFGDLPAMMNHLKHSKTLVNWLEAHNHKKDSPIVQVFVELFGTPMVVVNDFREIQDITLRRSKEFDKPDAISDAFYGIIPEHHTVKPMNDEWRYQRKLMQDLMSPGFLNNIAAPQVYASFTDLTKLWSEKLRLSEGHPFSVKHDVYETALDAIWAVVFSSDNTATVTRNQISLLSAVESVDVASSIDEEITFPHAPAPPEYEAILRMTDGIEHVLKSPFPRITGFVMRYIPSWRKHNQVSSRTVAQEIAKAEKRIPEIKGDTGKMVNAVDHMLRREDMAAEKAGRLPSYQSKAMAAELSGLLVAGHDTTSTTLLWAVRFFTENQSIQQKLRSTLHDLFPAARSENRLPTAQEIARSQSHYLDACMEETIRCSGTSSLLTRTALTDVVILGHIVPKGTRIGMTTQGSGFKNKPFQIDDSKRNETYRKSEGGRIPDWDVETMDQFDPDRWLVTDKSSGEKVFDAAAGPQMAFGAGPRGCFGRKLAYLELRIAFVLIFWSFELQPVPEKYASWEAIDQLTHSPIQCYVKLKKAE